ncbi:MAG: hypothetical protein CMF96_09920 [Candidatus Marinimicrobia bacterium]|nr:hypothetical protein [Candidatus Neomarinimicrobiota bacterium]
MSNLTFIIIFMLLSFLSGGKFDPTTGELIQDSTKVQFKYDPLTGLPIIIKDNSKINQIEPNNINVSTKFLDIEVKDKAIKDANNDFMGFFWTVGGGPGSLWASFLTGQFTAEVLNLPSLALPALIGNIYLLPHVFSNTVNVNIPYYHKIYCEKNFSSLQIKLYENEYKKEIEILRLKAVRKGQGGTAGIFFGFVFLVMASL